MYNIELNNISIKDTSFSGAVNIDGVIHEIYGMFWIEFYPRENVSYIEAVNIYVQGHWVKMNLKRLNILDIETKLNDKIQGISEI